MTESEYLVLAEAVLNDIEIRLEQIADSSDVDIECSRSGNVLEIEFIDTDSKIIVNTQAPMQEIWMAARTGGFHYRFNGQQWLDTRDGSELYAALSKVASLQAGSTITL
ncbi:MAG: iron donor protein CyaY [Burkholderiaceae bacterium]|jgi:CyaY protein|nr:iron donor protein CyaY [Polynucleobacter sp.]MCF8187913.1 iron donor protein CyaY [Sulfuritalea sp.]